MITVVHTSSCPVGEATQHRYRICGKHCGYPPFGPSAYAPAPRRGEVWAWLMNGTTRTSQTYVGTVGDVGYQIVGVADHTGDGKADILWHHATRGEVWIWPMNGATVLSQSYVDTVTDTGYQIVGNGDYNGDTKADILWHHTTRGEVWVWLMNGTTKLSDAWVATVPELGYQVVRVK